MDWITISDIKERDWTININCIAAILWKKEGAVVYLTTLRGSFEFPEGGVGELEADKIILSAESGSSLSKQIVLSTERASAFVKKDFPAAKAS